MSGVEEDICKVEKPKGCMGVRHIQVIMIFLGMIIAHFTRTVMSLAIVDMTNPSNEKHFNWTMQRQSVILSSFTWGYVAVQIVSGVLDRKFGSMTLMVVCIGANSLFSFLLPAAAMYGGWIMVCVCRGIQGLTQGTIIPTITSLLAKWAPPSERARMTSFVFCGSYLGTALQFIGSGYIAAYWGWPSIFYVIGVVGVIWIVIYLYIGSDNPQLSKSISTEERIYIQSSLGQIGGYKNLKTPWKSILTSLPFLAVLVGNVGFSWGYWTLLTEIPTYMSKVLQVDIKSNGVISALPYLTIFVMNFPIGFTSDYIVRKHWVSVTTCRKIFNSFGFFGTALCLYCLTYIPPGNVTLAVVTLCVAMAFNSGYFSGFIVAYIDIAPNFTSTLVALGNFTANFLGLFAPIFAGFVIKDEYDPAEWHIVFYVSSATYVVANIFFLVFANSEQQPWNQPDIETEDRSKTIIKA